jgi:hypothetical protein
MHPQFLTAVILKMRIFWGVMLCLCVIHIRILEGTRIFRNPWIHSSNKTKSQNWSPKSLGCSLLLHFILLVIFCDFVLTFIHLSQLSRDNLLELWSDAILKLIFSPSIVIHLFWVLDTVLRSVPLNVVTYSASAIWWLDFKPSNQWIFFLQEQNKITNCTQRNKLT